MSQIKVTQGFNNGWKKGMFWFLRVDSIVDWRYRHLSFIFGLLGFEYYLDIYNEDW